MTRGWIGFSAMALAALLALSPLDAGAEPAPGVVPVPYGPADGLIRLNDRWFDAHAPVDPDWQEIEFFPVQRIPWIKAVLDAEPLLDTMVIHIEAQPQASARVFGNIYDEESGYSPTRDAPDFLLPPDGFELLVKPGGRGEYVIRPSASVAGYDYQGLCGARPDREALFTCNAHAEYPDPRLYLRARVYGPPPRMDDFTAMLPAVAARLREITFCLDVTDEVLAGTWRPSPPPEDATLTGCDADGERTSAVGVSGGQPLQHR